MTAPPNRSRPFHSAPLASRPLPPIRSAPPHFAAYTASSNRSPPIRSTQLRPGTFPSQHTAPFLPHRVDFVRTRPYHYGPDPSATASPLRVRPRLFIPNDNASALPNLAFPCRSLRYLPIQTRTALHHGAWLVPDLPPKLIYSIQELLYVFIEFERQP